MSDQSEIVDSPKAMQSGADPDGHLLREGRTPGTIDAYVAFEGGGARGIGHVGVLRALEDPFAANGKPTGAADKINIKGVAGTSAGAIVAALVAAGYRADQLLSEDGRRPLFSDSLGLNSATQLFGRTGWRRVVWLRRMFKVAGFFAQSRGARYQVWILGPVSAFFLGLFLVHPTFLAPFGSVAVGLVLIGLFLLGWVGWRLMGGLCDTGTLELYLNRALSDAVKKKNTLRKLEGAIAETPVFSDKKPVTFKALVEAFGVPLRIVATNVDDKRMVLFSEKDTPDVPVARAVAASVAIPFVFRPPLVKESEDGRAHQYFDGGLVSNLPAWTFDEELELDPDTVVIAAETSAPNPATCRPGRLQTTINTVQTTIFGARDLYMRGLNGRLHNVPFDSRLGTLDFDAGVQKFTEEARKAAERARSHLTRDLFEMPNLVHQICGLFMADVRRTLIGSPLKGNDFVRVNLSAPDPGGHLGLRILGHVGMDDDTDKNILLPMDTSGPGIAYRKREACLFLLRNGKLSLFEAEKAGSSNHASMDGRRDRFRKRLTRDDLQWFLCIPLEVEVDGRNPVYVLTVDSNIKQERCRLEEVIDTRERLSSYAGRVTERVQPLLGRLDRMRSYGER